MTRRLLNRAPVDEQAAQIRLLTALERLFRRELSKEIGRTSTVLLKHFAATGNVPPIPETHARNLRDIYTKLARTSIEMFALRIFTQKSGGKPPERKNFGELFDRLAAEYLQMEMIRGRITNVSNTTRQQIIDAVDRGLTEQESIELIARRIAGSVRSVSRTRAALIARTEVHGAANWGADRAARESGLDLRKEWVSTVDDRTRMNHMAANGQIRTMDEPFDVGGEKLMFPGDPSASGANVINCRCAVVHLLET